MYEYVSRNTGFCVTHPERPCRKTTVGLTSICPAMQMRPSIDCIQLGFKEAEICTFELLILEVLSFLLLYKRKTVIEVCKVSFISH